MRTYKPQFLIYKFKHMSNTIFYISRLFYWLCFLALINLGCSNYYKPVTANTINTDVTGKIITAESSKYFILRQGTNSYALKNITIDNEKMTLNATLETVSDLHMLYLKAKNERYRYHKGDKENQESGVLNEVHIYSNNTEPLDVTKAFVLPLGQIQKIEVIEHDRSRTTTSYVLGGVGIGLGVVAVTTVIVALTKSSCPFVSVYDGDQYSVQGELFGGAVNRNLERSDYLPLKIKPVQGEFRLRISNELKERQYTNYADLVVIEHAGNVQAGYGTDGNIYTLSNPVTPITAKLNESRDILKTISQEDGLTCNFDDTLSTSATNEVTLSFQQPVNQQKSKLVLGLKNAYWFDYLFGEFTRYFGSRYSAWQKKQENGDPEKMKQWIREQQIPLHIFISTATGWKELVQLNTIGPLTNRQVIIPVDIPTGKNAPVKIKLSTGFMFWELDYALMDFSADEPVTTTTLHPYYAVDEKGIDVISELSGNDEKYVVQPAPGNFATLKYSYNRPVVPGRSYSVVLSTKGYYEPVREYTGKANIRLLKSFKEPGALAAFSKNKYQSILRNETIIALNRR